MKPIFPILIFFATPALAELEMVPKDLVQVIASQTVEAKCSELLETFAAFQSDSETIATVLEAISYTTWMNGYAVGRGLSTSAAQTQVFEICFKAPNKRLADL